MGTHDELGFDVYVRTRHAVVTIVREVSFRTAHMVARHEADTRAEAVYIRSRRTNAVQAVGPSAHRVRID